MYEFARSLKAAGVTNALYMDMGSMKYSAYKPARDTGWTEIHASNSRTQYCSNYQVFVTAG